MIGRVVHLLRRRIAVKLTLTLVGFVGVTLLVAGLYLDRALEGFAVQSLEGRLATAGRLLEDRARPVLLQEPAAAAPQAFAAAVSGATAARVSLIAPDGRVLGDSDVPLSQLPWLENHASRPEVRMALAGRVGSDLRKSATLGSPLLYVGVPVGDGRDVVGVLRLALPLSDVTSAWAPLRRSMLFGGMLALLVAVAIGLFVARRVTRPVIDMQAIAGRMSAGDFTVRAPAWSPDEIGSLGRALNAMAGRLHDRIAELEQERTKVGAILDGMVEGVIAVDDRDRVLVMNDSVRRMFGLGAHGGEARPFLEVIRNAHLHQLLRDTRSTAEPAVLHRTLTVGGPIERVLQVNALPLRLGDRGVGALMVLHDVTELRRLELVRTEFVANVSHELRTPLTAIQGYLETLLGGALEERDHAREFLDIVARHTARLGRLLGDLTDLSNIELGRVVLRMESVALEEAVVSVMTIMRPRAEQGRVTLASELPSGLPEVRADRDRLVQILLNLVDNAVKYTREGGSVTVDARQRDGMVEIAVRDTGTGIPATDLPRITERFYRVDKARSRELGGTGLGLAIVKHLVLAHGGDLSIESEPGRGTDVRFTLPAARRDS